MVISCGVRTFGSAVEGMVCLLVGFVLFLCLTNWVRFELDGKGKVHIHRSFHAKKQEASAVTT